MVRALRAALGVGLLAAVAAAAAPAAGALAADQSHCFGVLPGGGEYSTIGYPDGCYGHDEPMLNPISNARGSSSNITWEVILPTDGAKRSVLDEGPTFWFGAGVNDRKSFFGQAFEELQFYPDSFNRYCGPDGSFDPHHQANTWTVCSPVWKVTPDGVAEEAAFNGLLKRAGTNGPLVMHSGDRVRVHYLRGPQRRHPLNILVTDLTTHQQSAPLALISKTDGPLTPTGSTNTDRNYLKWGAVYAPPLEFSWEIGHPNFYKYPFTPECLPGMFNCYSYNVPNGWLNISPIQIVSVKFNHNKVKPNYYETVDGQGGSFEDELWCGSYNAPGSNGSCTFPWYTYNGARDAVEFGGNYPGTTNDFNTYHQFVTEGSCPSPFAPDFQTYCGTKLTPTPPIP
jgi:hypothetical protein